MKLSLTISWKSIIWRIKLKQSKMRTLNLEGRSSYWSMHLRVRGIIMMRSWEGLNFKRTVIVIKRWIISLRVFGRRWKQRWDIVISRRGKKLNTIRRSILQQRRSIKWNLKKFAIDTYFLSWINIWELWVRQLSLFFVMMMDIIWIVISIIYEKAWFCQISSNSTYSG